MGSHGDPSERVGSDGADPGPPLGDVVSIGLLGSLRVERDGTEVPIASRMQRRLLATLTIDAGSVVSTDRLIDALWGEAPPASADKTLQAHVARLRKALGSPPGESGCVQTRPPGYLLDPERADLEHLTVADLLERAGGSARAEDAARLLERALAMWRGPALAEFRDEAFATAEAHRLDELHVRVQEHHAERLLELGRVHEAIDALDRLVREHPYRERPVELSMRALDRAGRRTDALRSYERFRARLADELGLVPSAELRAVESEMLDPDATPAPPARVVGTSSSTEVPSGEATEGGHTAQPARLWAAITPRETEVLDAIAGHLSNVEIAERLFISVRTVESHVSGLLRKLGAANRRELAELGRSLPQARPVRAELPSALSTAAAAGTFAGRADELSRLVDAFRRVESTGGRHLVVVAGEAGIGKTRLVAEAATQLSERAATIAFGRCDEEALVPYQPLAEMMAALVPLAPAGVTDFVAPTLRRVVPGLGVLPGAPAPAPGAGPAGVRLELFEAFDAVVSAAPGPVLVVVDDLQWADRSTLLALRYILRSAVPAPLMIAATVRAEDLLPDTELGQLVASLEGDGSVTPVELSGLSRDQAASIVAADFPRSSALVETAWERTGGNPFLLRELMRHLADTGAASLDSVPSGLREVVARRIARLEHDLVQMLTAAALIGETFRLGVAARAIDARPADLLDSVETALRAGLLVEIDDRPDTYRFAHALVRDALVQRLASSRRLHLHLRIADELERDGRDLNLAEISYHLHAALPEGDPDRLVEVAQRATAQAMDRLAYEQAVELGTMAIDAMRGRGASLESFASALLARGEARLRGGDGAAARADLVEAAEHATQAGLAQLLARAALGVGEAASIWGADDQLVELLERARSELTDADAALRARVTARLAQAIYYTADVGRRRSLSDLAVRDAAASGDDEALAWVLSARHAALWSPEDLDERVEAALEIESLAERSHQDEVLLRSQSLLVADLMERGDIEGARRATARHAELAHRLRQPIRLRDVSVWQGCWAMLEGRFDDAGRAIDQALALGSSAGDPNTDLIYWVQRYWLDVETGDEDDLDELTDAYERLLVENDHVPAWRAALAYLHAVRDERDAARHHFELIAADDFDVVPRDHQWLNAMTYAADTCAFLGDDRRANRLLALLTPFSDRVAIVDRAMICKGSVARHLGVVAATTGDRAAAERWLRVALARHESFGAVALVERTASELATVVDGTGSELAEHDEEHGSDRDRGQHPEPA